MGRLLYRYSILIQELHIKMLGSITVVVSFMIKRGGRMQGSGEVCAEPITMNKKTFERKTDL